MRKLVIFLWATGSAASAAALSPRAITSAVRVAWEGPDTRGCPAAAAEAKVFPEEKVEVAAGRGVERMLSGALLVVIGVIGVLGIHKFARMIVGASTASLEIPDEDDEDDEDDEAIVNAFVDWFDANRHMFPERYDPAPFSCDSVPSSDIDSDSDGDSDY